MDQDKNGISRRRFVGAASAIGAAGALGPLSGAAVAHGGDRHGNRGINGIPDEKIGIQLFTVRDLLADNELDLPGTFEMLKDAGYAEVEIGGTYDGRTAAEFRALAEAVRAQAGGHRTSRAATTPGAPNLQARARRRRGARAALRRHRLARPRARRPRTTATRRSRTSSTPSARRRATAGFKFYFHNHPTDFVARRRHADLRHAARAKTDPSLVWFELDIAWIEAGGQSAVDYVKANGKRFPLFHVKDLTSRADDAAAA